MTFDASTYGKRTLDFIERIRQFDRYDDISRAIVSELKWFGYSSVTSWSMPRAGEDQADCLLINTRPPEYIARYIEKNYLVRDPVVTELHRTADPFSWGDLRERRSLSRPEKSIMDEGREFGAIDGLIVPIVTPSGSMSVFSPCGEQLDLSPRARAAVELIGMFSVHVLKRAVAKHPSNETARERLTPREREIMQWVATGRSDEEIAEILILAPRTVTWHVENAKRKLDAHRRTHAVVQALRFGEISL
jgi:LuxR family quorum sensing-dependent transcriptional regulator